MLLLVVLAAMLIQIVADVVLSERFDALRLDGRVYHDLAEGLAERNQYGPPLTDRPPGWPMILSLGFRVFGSRAGVGLAMNVVFAGIAAALTVIIARRLGLSRGASAVAAIAARLVPWSLLLGATLYSETAYTALILGISLAVILARDRNAGVFWWALIGVATGFTTLVRPALVFWVPFAAALALRRRHVLVAAVFALGVVAAVVPWTLRNHARTGHFVIYDTHGGRNLVLANNDFSGSGQSVQGLPPGGPEDPYLLDIYHRDAGIEWIKQNPEKFVGRLVPRIVRTFDPVTLLLNGVTGSPTVRWAARALWAAILIGVGWGIALRRTGKWLVPLSMLAAQLGGVMIFGGGFRFIVPVLPFLAMWGVVGWERIARRVGVWPFSPEPRAATA